MRRKREKETDEAKRKDSRDYSLNGARKEEIQQDAPMDAEDWSMDSSSGSTDFPSCTLALSAVIMLAAKFGRSSVRKERQRAGGGEDQDPRASRPSV